MSGPPPIKLHTIRLLADDIEACVRFYEDVLGFEQTWGQLADGYVSIESGADVGISFFVRRGQADAMATGAEGEAAFVLEVDDVEAYAREITERGAKLVTTPTDQPDWGIRVAHLRDPEGRLIELMSPLPRERWSEWLKQEDAKYSHS